MAFQVPHSSPASVMSHSFHRPLLYQAGPFKLLRGSVCQRAARTILGHTSDPKHRGSGLTGIQMLNKETEGELCKQWKKCREEGKKSERPVEDRKKESLYRGDIHRHEQPYLPSLHTTGRIPAAVR